MTSYRLFLLRSALARFGRALAYHWLSVRAALRTGLASYPVTMVRYRLGAAMSGTGRVFSRLPRKAGSMLGLVAWFFGQLPAYLARVLEERAEDRAELRAERRLATAAIRAERAERRELRQARTAERRARRRAQLAEIKADREKRPQYLPVPAWLSRMERPERPVRADGGRRRSAPRTAMVAAAVAMVAAVPAYAILSGGVGSFDDPRATPAVAAPAAAAIPGTATPGTATPGTATIPGATPAPLIPGQSAGVPTGGPAATGPVVSGDAQEFVRTLPPLPSATPTVPAPPASAGPSAGPPAGPSAGPPAGTASPSEASIAGSPGKPLSEQQQRDVRRQAKWHATLVRAQKAAQQDEGK